MGIRIMRKRFILGSLLMVVFVFTFLINVSEVHAKGYGCKGNKQAVRQCLKNVIKGLEQEKADWKALEESYKERINELLDANEVGNIPESQNIIANLSGSQTSVGLSQENKDKINLAIEALSEQTKIIHEVVIQNCKGNPDELFNLANGLNNISPGIDRVIFVLKDIK